MKVLSDVQMVSVECGRRDEGGMSVDCAFALVGMGIAVAGLCVATGGIAAGGVMIATADAIGFGSSLFGTGWAFKDVIFSCL